MITAKKMIAALWKYYSKTSPQQPHVLMAADLLVSPDTVKRWVFDGSKPVNAGTLERISTKYDEKVRRAGD